ncbi:MAG: hypothetical protein J0H66_03115 [Solirubrobacterales bacterium]|nr:hypothetical protein [Solirubrobacterales bacterium]OJU96095.1 MAG: hypothetical protein BGO23_00780 [Solirubrobacterales bacterium 67-14]
MNRWGKIIAIAVVSIGLVDIGGTASAESGVANVDRSQVGTVRALGLNVKPRKLPATGLTRAIIYIRTSKGSKRQTLELKVRSSNPHVLTPRLVGIRNVKPGAVSWMPIAIQPGRKARGRTVITVTTGDLKVSDSLRITRPTPDADDWKDPDWRP